MNPLEQWIADGGLADEFFKEPIENAHFQALIDSPSVVRRVFLTFTELVVNPDQTADPIDHLAAELDGFGEWLEMESAQEAA